MATLQASPAEALQASIVAGAFGTDPGDTPGGTWPVFVGHMPPDPDNAICVYDTAGTSDGRSHRSGTVRHEGWQVRVRGKNYRTARNKLADIGTHFDTVQNEAVTVATVSYTITAVIITTDIFPLGQEPDDKRRDHFTLNGILTYKTT